MKKESFFTIYKFDFHKAATRDIEAEANGIDGNRLLDKAEVCFQSLFDMKTIDKLAKTKKNGELAMLPNDVLAMHDGIFLWRVNNSQLKEWWRVNGKDSKGIDCYEKDGIESNPYCYVLIDNRPGVGLMAIEKSSAWGGNPDQLRDVVRENFNRLLRIQFDLEMRIEARMNPKDLWEFVHERIKCHDDYIRRVTFSFQNPRKINRSDSQDIKSSHLRGMLRAVEIADALKGAFSMEFDRETSSRISQTNKDMAEMVNLCSQNGYDICIFFKEYKAYRINDYVRASYKLKMEALDDFRVNRRGIDCKTDVEAWFNLIKEETKNYVNESEVPRRRHRSGK